MHRRRCVPLLLVLAALIALLTLAHGSAVDSGNLLENGSMEQGTGSLVDAWRPIHLPGGTGRATFSWDGAFAHTGSHALRIDGADGARGIWTQTVPVVEGRPYEVSGYVAFDALPPSSDCHLQVVFRDTSGGVIEFVDLARHDSGARAFDLDFPARMIVRAPEGATEAEVNGYLSGQGSAWFDDIRFSAAPVGVISGRITSEGQPIAGARVFLWGDPWGEEIEATTDEQGVYRLTGVPETHPRYILIVEKEGYFTEPVGDVDVTGGGVTTVDVELEMGSDPLDDLHVGYGFLCLSHIQDLSDIPTYATRFTDPGDYVPEVRTYLESDAFVTVDDPEIQTLAAGILASLTPEDQRNAIVVARAVFDWISTHVNHDAVYGNNQPYLDVTSGIWQTIQPGGWCWGRNMYDWLYRPAELLEERTGICIEHSWLSAAVLRALSIPARARVGSAQFWVQNEAGDGGWYGFSTNGGSNTYRQTGRLGAGFGDGAQPTFYSVASEPFLQEDWDWEMPGLWREIHPWGEVYAGDAAGLGQASQDLAYYAETGVARSGTTGRRPGTEVYEINYSRITLSRWSLRNQSVIDVRFPAPTESAATTDTGEWAYWTNHPECVVETYVETIENPPVAEIQRWRHIVLDVSSLLESGS